MKLLTIAKWFVLLLAFTVGLGAQNVTRRDEGGAGSAGAIVNFQEPLSARTKMLSTTGCTMNAVGEECFLIGQIYFPAQAGSKTCSAAGSCRIFMNTASGVTWANVASNQRIGIQDVGADGLEDGTFDVEANYVPGTETLANNTLTAVTMEANSKVLTYGQIVAVGSEMTARGGVDQVTIDRASLPGGSQNSGFPYGVHLATKGSALPLYLIEFDDDTYGWINVAPLLHNTTVAASTITYGNASTPDEYAGIVTFPGATRIIGIGIHAGLVATTDTFEVILYSDPEGVPTPVTGGTITPDPDQLVTGQPQIYLLSTPYVATANIPIGIALRPTSANTITWSYFDLTTGFNVLKAAQPFSTIKMSARTNQTGAFVETQVYHLPDIFVVTSGM